MWEFLHKESWVWKNWFLWIVVLKKTLESLGLQGDWTSQYFSTDFPLGNRSWIFIGRTNAEAEVLIICPSNVKSSLVGKDLDAGKDWRQKKKGVAEDEMDIWHYQLSGHDFEQTLGDSEGLRSLACCGTMGLQKSNRT